MRRRMKMTRYVRCPDTGAAVPIPDRKDESKINPTIR